jgi:hypothetical protein
MRNLKILNYSISQLFEATAGVEVDNVCLDELGKTIFVYTNKQSLLIFTQE